MVERLREAVKARNADPARRFHLSLSVGTAYFDPEQPMALQDLLAEADERMYAQKQSSRG
jgi:GGDEF domain-containing protein